jgi:pilus assembly protein Flp/PilA
MINKLMQFLKDEEGATAVEYAVMVALIALVVMVGAALLGNSTNETFEAVGNAIPGNGG